MKPEVKKLGKVLMSIKDPKLMENFLLDILTPFEILDINSRLSLLKLLEKGVSQREISKKLGVSITTVTRGSRVLKFGHGGAKKLLEQKMI